ncbi:MAG: hydroxymethylbilane synthase [Nitrospira sp.]|nr:hydroxymethylbilane synthase [Nitrospira sp.]
MKENKVIIGTRGSKLALWQTEWVKSELERTNPGVEVVLKKIKTTGDVILDVPLAKVGGKGLFVKEIEEALLRNDINLAVHSMKDVPTELPNGLHIAAICKREDPRDAIIISQKSKIKNQKFKDLPEGAHIGTSSLRRSCQLLYIRPDLNITQLRGNLDTRVRKLDEGQFNAIILAVAGVKRLGLQSRITEILSPEISLPAIGQGAIGIECRINDEFMNTIVSPLDHKETSACVRAERAFLKKLGGGCQVPIAAYARIEQRAKSEEHRIQTSYSELRTPNSELNLLLIIDGLVGSVSGEKIIKGHLEGKPEDPEILGIKLAEDLLARGAKEILQKIYRVS